MKFLSVCSGIEAASVAWEPLGWRAHAVAEIEAFPAAVLAHHYPDVPNWGDMTRFKDWPDAAIDLLVGGTPCQSFSVAGLRKGMADPRGNLALTYLAIADRYRPEWLVWENVPGVLSSSGGRDFGAFLGGLGELGYGFAYRVLDAQYVRVDGFARAVPQRRRRVFVVGHSGDWRRAAAVLFEPESLSGNPPPRREAGERVADSFMVGANQCSGFPGDFVEASAEGVSHCLNAGVEAIGAQRMGDRDTLVPYTLAIRGRGDTHQLEYRQDGTANAVLTPNGGRAGIGVGAIAFGWQNSSSQGDSASEHVSPSLDKSKTPAVAFSEDIRGEVVESEISLALQTRGGKAGQGYVGVRQGWAVRRLTPTECERLQGFPDGYTAVPYRGKPAADGPRYKALGNSMAVNVMRWIGRRIALLNSIAREHQEAA